MRIFVQIVTCLSLLLLAGAKDIELNSDFRYVNVLVGIDGSVNEDPAVIDKIKAAFREASHQLSVATTFPDSRPKAFGHVRILVPSSWTGAVDETATWEAQDVAHFRVGNSSGGSRLPHTVQPGGCGQPGMHVNLHAMHLESTQPQALGKQLVHEFARLRWGVFNEFNDDSGPHAYLRNGRIEPVVCAASVRGKFGHKDTGNPCRVNRTTLQLEPDCRFLTEADQTAKASLMYSTYLSSVEHFCYSGSGDPDFEHNPDAPNPHNRRCRRRSVRDVMLMHQDFRRSSNQTETDINVEFTVVRRRSQRELVIVMDKSGSMGGYHIAKLKIAGKSLVMDQLEHNIKCGMLAFNARVETLKQMSPLNGTLIRTQYWDSIRRLVAGGGTAIGDGLAVAMEMLGTDVSNPNKNNTGYIVLLTDGQDNSKDRFTFPQAIEIAKKTSIVVDTIAFGNKADKRLADLSRDTGGKSYFASFNTPANDLIEAMSDLVRDRVDTLKKPIDVFSAPVTAGFSQSVTFDPTASNSPIITLSSSNVGDISSAKLQLTSPSGVLYTEANTTYEKDTTNGIITVRMQDGIEPGTWTIQEVGSSRSLPSSGRMALNVAVKASDDSVVILDGSISESKVNLTADTQVKVFATMSSGGDLVTGARVQASIEADSGSAVVVDLRDDGAGADSTANDGVYTGMVPSNVTTRQEYNVRLIATSPVSRVSTAGKFEIVNVDLNSLLKTPPADVEDLRAVVSAESRTIQLQWTAVGDMKMEGRASSYNLHTCNSASKLEDGDSSCNIQALSASPQPAGQQMSTTLKQSDLPQYESTFYLSVVAVNKAGIRSRVANAVAVQFEVPENVEELEGKLGIRAGAAAWAVTVAAAVAGIAGVFAA